MWSPACAPFLFQIVRAAGCRPYETRDYTTEKSRFVYRESALSFCLYSDMLTDVSVIFSHGESGIKPIGLSDILFAYNLASPNTTRLKAAYHCVAIPLAAGE